MHSAKPRVLVLQTILPHYRVPFFRRLCESQAAEFTIAFGDARPSDSLQSADDTSGVHVRHLRNRHLPRTRAGGSLRWQSGALGPILRRDIDVVVAEGDLHCLSTLVAFGLCRLRRIPFILWWHGIGPQSLQWLNPLRVGWARRASALIFYDPERPKWFTERGIPAEKVFVTWNTVDTDTVASLAAPWSATQRHRILYVGRLIARKKVDLLLGGFEIAVSDLPPDTCLTIVGDGPEADPLRVRASDVGIADRVEFTGSVTNEAELAPYFNTSFVSVSPGYVGLSIIHSMAYGLPMLVADNEPHAPEIVALSPGANGELFASGDAEALAACLVRMCADQQAMARMSSAARETVARGFSLGRMVRAFEGAVVYSIRGQPR
ncbi:MAG: glycosyltransferase [candidate division WS1 bacterium]|nr:glycosyltransferase [candidate division WS1 bacterium]